MAYISHTPVADLFGRSWKIIARRRGVYTGMLKSILGQLGAIRSYHNKIHVIRFDLHQHDNTPTNTRITDFNRSLFGILKTKYGLARIGYAWVREQETVDHPHYHYALMVDGNKVKHPKSILHMVESLWAHRDGSTWVPKNCYYNLKRNDAGFYQSVIFRLSYLAKATGKGKKPTHTKSYSTSRIKPKMY